MEFKIKCESCDGGGEIYSFDGESNSVCTICEGSGDKTIKSFEELLKIAFNAGVDYGSDRLHYCTPSFDLWFYENKPFVND